MANYYNTPSYHYRARYSYGCRGSYYYCSSYWCYNYGPYLRYYRSAGNYYPAGGSANNYSCLRAGVKNTCTCKADD